MSHAMPLATLRIACPGIDHGHVDRLLAQGMLPGNPADPVWRAIRRDGVWFASTDWLQSPDWAEHLAALQGVVVGGLQDVRAAYPRCAISSSLLVQQPGLRMSARNPALAVITAFGPFEVECAGDNTVQTWFGDRLPGRPMHEMARLG